MGTAAYMSPEQVRGEPLDARTDAFSFGLVLYEMATARRAFKGETAAVVLEAILNDSAVPVRELNPAPPAKLGITIDRCLEKERERRYQSAAEVGNALEEVQRAQSNREGWSRLALAGLVVLLLVALAIVAYVRHSSVVTQSGESSSSLDVRLLTESGKAIRAAATPDGRYVAYVNEKSGKYELRLMQVATDRDVQLLPVAPGQISSLHFSPDGNFLYFLRVLDGAKDPDASGVFRIATLGGPATLLATDARSNSVTVSPDGRQIAYIAQTKRESLIVAVDPDGTNRHILAKRPGAFNFNFVEWSSSENTLAAVAIGKADNGLVRVDLPAGSVKDERLRLGLHWSACMESGWRYHLRSCDTFRRLDYADMGFRRAHRSSQGPHVEFSFLPGGEPFRKGDLIANTQSADTTLWVTDHSGQQHSVPALRGEGSARRGLGG